MRILITGASGNIGNLLIPELIRREYSVNCLLFSNKKIKKIAKGVKVFYGDIRKKGDIKKAIKNCNIIIHLAFITPDICEKRPFFAYKVNVGGTKKLIQVAEEISKDIKIIFPSSISVYFYELNKNSKKIKSLRYIKYTKHKLECEKIIKSSSLNWCILRIGATLPTRFPILHRLLNITADAHFQFIHIKDVIAALINAAKTKKVIKKVLLIGGGEKFCMQYRDFVSDLFRIAGQKIPKDNDFISKPYLTDCFDTTEGQKILKYQKHNYRNFLREMRCQINKGNRNKKT